MAQKTFNFCDAALTGLKSIFRPGFSTANAIMTPVNPPERQLPWVAWLKLAICLCDVLHYIVLKPFILIVRASDIFGRVAAHEIDQ